MPKYNLQHEFMNLSDPVPFFKPECNSFTLRNTGSDNIQIKVAGSAAILIPGETMRFSANDPEVIIVTEFSILPEVSTNPIKCLIVKEFINAL